ncbi:hypothetical protein [Streptomyces capillispiralis]|uniref:Tat pathway signal sequence domain protein n=1 Tax=Streptomyces capillispiralis TaxID=68182 RepID=A0A561TGV7_9ACTN|nr:hypothetical protein [Streptomyces capillispiralis]TWF86301.1 hypothetical protein FHX78_113266 [Streptomyces capillispiralis]GHH91226.1 hypothetical protein GCM10017779_16830 [Streptomyces capillispiralis]
MDATQSDRYGRRRALRGALGITGSLALGMTALGTPARASVPRRDGPGLPEVPGMLGDRLANEFWYQFDEATYFRQTPELVEAYAAVAEYTGGNPLGGVRAAWVRTGTAAGYPDTYASFLEPVRGPLAVISRVQVDVFERYYGRDHRRIVEAMAYFAQGVLFDPRRAPTQSEVHTMDGDPPLAYHTWHAYQYASVLLGIDRRFWTSMIPVNGFAWAVQLLAKPRTRTVNPPLPRSTVARVAAEWLPRGVRRVDAQLLAFHRPPDDPGTR